MRILLINAPSAKPGAVFNKLGIWIPGEQLGICYLAAVLRRDGHQVSILDAFLLGLSPDQVVQFINDRVSATDLIGLSISDGKVEGAVEILQQVDNLLPHCHLTLGGHTATLCAIEFLSDYPRVDSVVIGEA